MCVPIRFRLPILAALVAAAWWLSPAVADEPAAGGPAGENGANDPVPNVEGVGEVAPEPVIRLSIDEVHGRPGEDVAVRVSLFTDTPLRSLALAVNFDETQVFLRGVRDVRENVAPEFQENVDVIIDNGEERIDGPPPDPVDAVDDRHEGFVILAIDTVNPNDRLAVGQNAEVPIFDLVFRVRRHAVNGFTAVRFEEIGPVEFDDVPAFVRNTADVAVEAGVDAGRREIPEEDLGGGGILIIGEIGFFLRGDTDMNCERDLSDPVRTLQWLFLGAAAPGCLDAADADDSGEIDLGDPVFTLNWLFNHGTDFREPYLGLAIDPTPDCLTCNQGFEDERGCETGVRIDEDYCYCDELCP